MYLFLSTLLYKIGMPDPASQLSHLAHPDIEFVSALTFTPSQPQTAVVVCHGGKTAIFH